MPRARTPTQLLALNGGLSKNPGRYQDRAAEPQDDRALGDPPPHLGAAEQAVWREIHQLSVEGVLVHADRLIVEMAAVLLAQFRRAGNLMPLPAIARLQSILSELGMTPASRSKVQVSRPLKAKPNPFLGLGVRPKNGRK